MMIWSCFKTLLLGGFVFLVSAPHVFAVEIAPESGPAPEAAEPAITKPALEPGQKTFPGAMGDADVDQDGILTKAEFMEHQEKRWSEMDINNDAKVDREEEEEARQKWRAIMAEKGREKTRQKIEAKAQENEEKILAPSPSVDVSPPN